MSDINSTQSMWGHPNTALTMNDLFTIHPNLCWYANRCPGKCVTGVGLRWRVVSGMTGWLGSSVVTCPHGQRKALGRATYCAPNINNPLWRGGSVVECSHGQRKTIGASLLRFYTLHSSRPSKICPQMGSKRHNQTTLRAPM